MNKPMHVSPQADFDIGQLYGGRYMKADDLNGRSYVATIAAVERVEIAEQDGSVRAKAALTLESWPAKLLMNKVNFETLAASFGRQSANWLGKAIEVYPDVTFFGGRSVACVRVRVPRPIVPTIFPASTPPAAAPMASPASAPPVPAPVPAIATSAPPTAVPAAASAAITAAGDFPYNLPS